MPNAMVSYAPLSAYYAPGAPLALRSIVTGSFDDASQSPSIMTAHPESAVTVGQYRPVGASVGAVLAPSPSECSCAPLRGRLL